jgi:hypothetical protein
MSLIKKSTLSGHLTLILFSPLPLLTGVASPAGPSFLPVVAPFEKKRIGVAYHQKKQHGSGLPPANSQIQNSHIQAVTKIFPFENFECVQTVQGDIKISFALFFSRIPINSNQKVIYFNSNGCALKLYLSPTICFISLTICSTFLGLDLAKLYFSPRSDFRLYN